MNTINLTGGLTADVETRQTKGEKPVTVANARIAVARRFGDKVDYFNLVAFDSTAEFMSKYMKKGSQVALVGTLENDNYEKDGKTVYRNVIRINEIEFQKGNSKASDSTASDAAPAPAPAPAPADEPLPWE